MPPTPRLVIGLGNPTGSYAKTRHNIGRDFIKYCAGESRQPFEKSRQADILRLPAFFNSIDDTPVLCARLKTYMNVSGPAVRSLLQKESLDPKDMVIVVDDFMIPFGSFRLRPKGSAGGHNGLKSIIETLGTQEFGRLRVGVGPVPPNEDPGDYVLERFSRLELARQTEIFDIVKNSLEVLIKDGYERAMTQTNKQHFDI